MNKIWKEIRGYDGFYKISNCGDVYNSKWDRPVKQHINKSNGYYEVCLYKKQKRKHHTIHRLVALHFVGILSGREFVNHKDSDKHNNDSTNLEWVTKSENGIHAGKAGLLSVNLRKNVNQLTKEGNFIKTHISLSSAARELNLQKTNISSCCYGKSKTCGGFLWEFTQKDINRDQY